MGKIPTEDFAQRNELDGTEVIFSQSAVHSPPEQKFTLQQVVDFIQENSDKGVMPIKTVDATYTATTEDYTLLLDAALATFDLTLPAAELHPGRMYRLVSVFANPSHIVRLVTSKGNFIQGQNSTPTVSISTAPDVRLFQSDGEDWILVGRY